MIAAAANDTGDRILPDTYHMFRGGSGFEALHQMEGTKILSLELFNQDYWLKDPLLVAKTGLKKMKSMVGK